MRWAERSTESKRAHEQRRRERFEGMTPQLLRAYTDRKNETRRAWRAQHPEKPRQRTPEQQARRNERQRERRHTAADPTRCRYCGATTLRPDRTCWHCEHTSRNGRPVTIIHVNQEQP